MSEGRNQKIKEIEDIFKKRLDVITSKEISSNSLDGGDTDIKELWDWFRAECKKIREEYPEE